MADRPTVTVQAPVGGWAAPWPSVAEIEAALPSENWTLIGGLMTQIHAIHHRIDAVRPTNDIDIILHVETDQDRPARVATALERLGYELRPPVDPRANTAHRWIRGTAVIDVVTGHPDEPGDIVDVVVADHAAPRVLGRMKGKTMVQVEGGTQALRRTITARLDITPGRTSSISVPGPFGALILKAAAYRTDHRDRDRHLADAALLLACLTDPFDDRARFAGSDRSRLLTLQRALADPLHPAWLRLPDAHRRNAEDALAILCEG